MLTRVQYIAGDTSQGGVLPNQVQGVKQGSGLIISPEGFISFDGSTVEGVVRTNRTAPSAFNGYVWPTTPGGAGQALTLSQPGNILYWSTPPASGTVSANFVDSYHNEPPGPDSLSLPNNLSNIQIQIIDGITGVSTLQAVASVTMQWQRPNFIISNVEVAYSISLELQNSSNVTLTTAYQRISGHPSEAGGQSRFPLLSATVPLINASLNPASTYKLKMYVNREQIDSETEVRVYSAIISSTGFNTL
jgi:hypothetical protein